MEIPALTLERFKQASAITTKAVHRIQYPSDVLKLDMKDFFSPKEKRDKALLFGLFSKYHHDKIRDAYVTCEKGWKRTAEEKYKNLKYLIGIVKRL